jgi:hypothetical protein
MRANKRSLVKHLQLTHKKQKKHEFDYEFMQNATLNLLYQVTVEFLNGAWCSNLIGNYLDGACHLETTSKLLSPENSAG